MQKQFLNFQFYYKTDRKEANEAVPDVVEEIARAGFDIGRLNFYLSITEGEGQARVVPLNNYTKEVFFECSR